jgi:hypothetical protein
MVERIYDARRCQVSERQIKGWSRAKKLALIRGDWERIAALVKGKDSPSTSSGQTELENSAEKMTTDNGTNT